MLKDLQSLLLTLTTCGRTVLNPEPLSTNRALAYMAGSSRAECKYNDNTASSDIFALHIYNTQMQHLTGDYRPCANTDVKETGLLYYYT